MRASIAELLSICSRAIVSLMIRQYILSFFFSSRRRHTRYWRDWSSDVCSSDLSRGRIDPEAIRALLAHHPLAGAEASVYAVDVSVWDRCDAECSPERGFYYHPSRHSAGQPIVAGWAYQFIAQLNFVRESWTAPMDVERLRPAQDTNEVAAEQVKAFLRLLAKEEEEEERAAPLFVFDAGYDPVKVQQGLEGAPCQILVRLRAGRRFYGDPSLAGPPASTGRPRRHGPKMKCNDPGTWPEPSAEHACEDTGYGSVRVRAWAKMHPKVQNHKERGSRGLLPIVVGTLILVEVERLPRGERRREPRVLWLWWHGPEGTMPDLDLIWRSYVDRKSTRLNSSHANISYAVFCLKKPTTTPCANATAARAPSVRSASSPRSRSRTSAPSGLGPQRLSARGTSTRTASLARSTLCRT